jgi:hypothetical protein
VSTGEVNCKLELDMIKTIRGARGGFGLSSKAFNSSLAMNVWSLWTCRWVICLQMLGPCAGQE